MYESKDTGFTLFGRRIQANPDDLLPQTPLKSEALLFKDYSNGVSKVAVEGPSEEEKENQGSASVNEEQTNSGTSSSEQEKTLKKPDKIIPCPRCSSSDTKFCYFNNYNVNQPRYFCKNCQRYWTAGGTMRNVPVGAGRRKNKHLCSQYRQILVSCDGAPGNCIVEAPVAADHRLVSSDDERVLKFGPDAPHFESTGNAVDMGSEMSPCVSSMTNCSVPGSELPVQKEIFVPHPMHCYPAAPWMFPAQYPSQLVNRTNPNEVQFCPAPMLGFYPTSVPLQFVPASYWGCMPLCPAEAGPSPATSNSCCSGNGSPTLGKHGRDVNFIDEEKPGKGIVAPRNPRVDDPDEASRSPVWASLGIKHSQADSLRKGTIFRAFKSKAAGNSQPEGHAR